jgi:rare lipoprotein A
VRDKGRIAMLLVSTAWASSACARESGDARSPMVLSAPGPALTQPPAHEPTRAPGTADTRGFSRDGEASYYSDRLAGHRTASGARYDPRAFSGAHRSLPFGCHVRVTRADSGRSVVVVINDRGPFGDERRIIDLSRAAAEQIDMIREGVVPVHLDVVSCSGGYP